MKSRVGDFPLFIVTNLITYLQRRCETFQAGYITHCVRAWQRITNDREIISTVTGLKIDFDTEPTQHYIPNSKLAHTRGDSDYRFRGTKTAHKEGD